MRRRALCSIAGTTLQAQADATWPKSLNKRIQAIKQKIDHRPRWPSSAWPLLGR
ncbi:hypothetical protein [Polaromonas aquatica]|uniref:hypothetical protein n=1 Tax=Polaromonas aquatica TaxID=332657 RepID=UPI003D65B385